MKLAYVTIYDARVLGTSSSNEWSGTGYYIAEAIKSRAVSLEYIGPLESNLTIEIIGKLKRHYHELFHKTYVKHVAPLLLKNYAKQVSQKLSTIEPDIIFSATVEPIAYLECDRPIVFWADATFANLIDFYPQYSNLCQESINCGHRMEKLALQKCDLAIYASDWAAQTAIDYYQADPSKVKVVPFGANLKNERNFEQVKTLVKSRPSNKCKLLFLGVDWYRKGGDIALKIAKELNKKGLETELTVVGCQPIVEEPLPDFVNVLGFISKSSQEGLQLIHQLISESHFLILPSIAECYGVVLCEANSFGVPCLATKVGGIPTIIKNNVNGRLFNKNADIVEYCQYIAYFFRNYPSYEKLALSSFHEYKSRLNWSVAGQTIKKLLTSAMPFKQPQSRYYAISSRT
ncbi:group 1 glycosyl transferase [Hydrococcus rivularis NIES-593]|uniref:Group 1 glycosyl transferase n=1 Tax=Hydrococcus rivularis NIES-593 TaxID=1921803 RepID=A0A1U7HHI3_9CYAN|nr:glycosyltransferase family 4 protein [Hydrococcus rivularis]OKH23027.1 group 1 glycosyl transferase [Hydrococcus rivularis NIES-593]